MAREFDLFPPNGKVGDEERAWLERQQEVELRRRCHIIVRLYREVEAELNNDQAIREGKVPRVVPTKEDVYERGWLRLPIPPGGMGVFLRWRKVAVERGLVEVPTKKRKKPI